jgi:hypothetical protein
MDDTLTRIAGHLVDRVTGPMRFRLLLQPIMASFFAIRSGLADAQAGKPPYFWSLLWDSSHRREMLEDGWKGVGKVFVLAIVLDIAYQVIVARFVYLGETLLVGFILAIVPYVILRGLTTRFAAGK